MSDQLAPRYTVPDEEFAEVRKLEHMIDKKDLEKACLLVVSMPLVDQVHYHKNARAMSDYLRTELTRIGVLDHVGILIVPDSVRTTLHALPIRKEE